MIISIRFIHSILGKGFAFRDALLKRKGLVIFNREKGKARKKYARDEFASLMAKLQTRGSGIALAIINI